MGRKGNSLDVRLMSKVSSMYYNHDYKQQEIADRLHISRPKVSRLLKRARNKGIIQISITSPDHTFLELETKLEEKYGLKEVVLIESDLSIAKSKSNQILKRQLGSAASDFLNRSIKRGNLIGVTWGTTLQAMIECLRPIPTEDVHVVQTLGGVGPPEAKAHASDISRRLSQLLDCGLTLLPAPGIVDSLEAKNILLSERQVNTAVEKFPNLDILFVGIGSLQTNPVLSQGIPDLSQEIKKDIINSNAVGDIGLRFFNQKGEKTSLNFDDLIIGITIDQIKEVDTVVGIAGGDEKIEAIRGALKGKLINVLITDNRTAQQLLID